MKAYHGEAGSQRPDFYNPVTNSIVEVKNYTVTTASGRNNLANNIVNQYNNRRTMFPDADITFEIDVKGQAFTSSMESDIVSRITSRIGENKCTIRFFD